MQGKMHMFNVDVNVECSKHPNAMLSRITRGFNNVPRHGERMAAAPDDGAASMPVHQHAYPCSLY